MILDSQKTSLCCFWMNTCLSALFLHLQYACHSLADNTQIPTHSCALVSLTWWITPVHLANMKKKKACWQDSVAEAARRPLGVTIKIAWSRDISWKWATRSACHQSIGTPAVDVFSLLLRVSLSLPHSSVKQQSFPVLRQAIIRVFHVSVHPITAPPDGS